MSKEENKNKDQILNTSEEKDYAWKNEQEIILKKWADKALCLKMMHERSHRRFWCLNAWFNIPVIILSTITGAGNIGSASFSNSAPYISYIIGSMNIFAGILATIATYTGVAQKVEAHRFACVSWDKFSRKIQIELAKSRKDRIKAKDFIKQSAEEYDRLIEISPILPYDIIRWFTTMIQTGEFEKKIGNCNQCCFECFCFPFGCNYCKCFNLLCCKCLKYQEAKTQEEIDNNKIIKASWKLIELPEIIGRIKPTEIANEKSKDFLDNDPNYITPSQSPLSLPSQSSSPLIIIENKKENDSFQNLDKNSDIMV
jgi:hypothetical protein